jgi:hypothetical protein
MAHYAQVINGIVEQVLVIDQESIDTGAFGDPSQWIQTSYNTYGGVHLTGGVPLRKNFAGLGFTYDSVRDAFIPPKLFSSWTLNEDTCLWESPKQYPEDGRRYIWDEFGNDWVAV